MERAANDVEYRLMALGERHLLDTSEGKVTYLREAMQLLAELHDPLERDVYLRRLAQDLSVSVDALQLQLKHQLEQRRRKREERQMSQVIRQTEEKVKKVNPEATKHLRAASAEEALLGILLLHPDYFAVAKTELTPDTMVTPFNRTLYERLLTRYEQGLVIELSVLAEEYEPEEMAYITGMLKESRERGTTLTKEDVAHFAAVIKKEHQLLALKEPTELTPEEIQEKLQLMRKMKS